VTEDWSENPYDGFPNRISRILLLAVWDVMDENTLDAVLATARLTHLADTLPPMDFEAGLSFEELGRLSEAIESIRGIREGRRLLRQAGKISFQYWIEGFERSVGFADFALRLLPMTFRARLGMEVMAEIFNRYSGQHVTLSADSNRYFFVLDTCGFCRRPQTESPACSFVEGLLEEVLFWFSRGSRFLVEETSCIACGEPVCMLTVDKVPLG
jgi:predicted hydrocarbon binding protein